MIRYPLAVALVVLPITLLRSEPLRVPSATEIDRLIQQLGSDRFAEREKASRRLEIIGEPALEALSKATKSADTEIRKRAIHLEKTIQARATCQVLIRSLQDSDEKVRLSATEALIGMGRTAVPQLIQLLQAKHKAPYIAAVGVFHKMALMGQRHHEAIPALLK